MWFKLGFKPTNPPSGLQDHVKEKARLLAAGCNLAQLGFHLQVGITVYTRKAGGKLFMFIAPPISASPCMDRPSPPADGCGPAGPFTTAG